MANKKTRDVKTKEELEREWWALWRNENFSWDGLAEKEWVGWSVTATGEVLDTISLSARVHSVSGRSERGGVSASPADHSQVETQARPATLQDYWRLNIATQRIRADAEMVGEFVRAEGQPAYHVAHLPMIYENDEPAKAAWDQSEKAALDAMLSIRLGSSAETQFEGPNYNRGILGADHRAQFQGCVLFGSPVHPIGKRHPLSVRYERAFFSESASFGKATFSGDANFDGANFTESVRLDSAVTNFDALGALVPNQFKQVDRLLDDLRVPESERKEVKQNLTEAIDADFLVRLASRLSDDGKGQLTQIGEQTKPGQTPDWEAVAALFRSKFSQKALTKVRQESTESVVQEFNDAMKSPAGAGLTATGNAGFVRAMRSGVGHFDQAAFNGKASFYGATFAGDASFQNAIFHEDARFDGTIFLKQVSFDHARFSKRAFFQNIYIGPEKKADFSAAKFNGAAHFDRSTFHGETNFYRALFRGTGFFEECHFLGDTTFERSTFADIASFAETVFAQSTSFQLAQFAQRANFSSAKFLQGTTDGRLDFSGTHFSGLALFQEVSFPKWLFQFSAAFDGAVFDSVAYFRKSGLHWVAAFDGAIFGKALSIDRVTRTEADRLFFGELLCGSRKQARADLKAKIALEQKQRIERPKPGLGAQPITKDEKRTWARDLPEQRLQELEGGCRVVKVAMGRQRDEALEQRYYRFQLIARTRQRDTSCIEKLYSWLYGTLADYGMGLWQPFVVWIALTLAFAGIFWGWGEALRGWPEASLSFSFARPINQDAWDALLLSANNTLRPLTVWSADFPQNSGSAWINGFLNAFGEPNEGGQRLAIRLVATLQSILSVIMVFFLVLAVRRRFQIS